MKKKLVSIMLVAAMALSVAACGSSKGNCKDGRNRSNGFQCK